MLSSLILDNFKAFGTRQVIPLAPITLIFGANSAGKSSVLQSLLLLKQTLAQAENRDTFLLPKGEFVNLGSFRELIHRHDTDRTLEIAPLLSGKALEILVPESFRASMPSSTRSSGEGFRFQFDKEQKSIQLTSIAHYWGHTHEPLFELMREEPPNQIEDVREPHRQVRSKSQGGQFPIFIDFADIAANFVTLGRINPNHPLWSDYYSEFGQPLLEGYMSQLQNIMEILVDRGRPKSSKRPSQRDIGIMQRALEIQSANIAAELIFLLSQNDDWSESEYQGIAHNILGHWRRRFSEYDLSQYLEDIQARHSQRFLALKNFLTDSTGSFASARNQVDFLFGILSSASKSTPKSFMPDIPSMSFSLSSVLRRVFERMVYLGPLRDYPERHYVFSGNMARDVGKSGSFLSDLLFRRPRLVNETNDILKEFGIGYQLDVRSVKDPDVEDVFALRLVEEGSQTTVSLLDVGFGVSQVLPIIVQSMLSRRNVIMIEQPEIHLHPKLQAELGTLFARCIGGKQQNQFIIETHSEHLILRLQRLIRNQQLNASDVSVIYVMKDEEGSHCYPLRLDSQGEFIDAWPEGFFEEGFKEMFG